MILLFLEQYLNNVDVFMDICHCASFQDLVLIVHNIPPVRASAMLLSLIVGN
jgi:hypothetical protein